MGPFRRSLLRFRDEPSSIRRATRAVISLMLVTVVIGAVIVRVFDREEFPTFGRALWFMLQTVTTVGYGDVTPETGLGRAVAAIVMVVAIGLLTVVTGAITSAFVEAARRRSLQRDQTDQAHTLERLEAALVSISERLERIESIQQLGSGSQPGGATDRDTIDP